MNIRKYLIIRCLYLFVILLIYVSFVEETHAETYFIDIQDFEFKPSTFTIQKGSTVTWINRMSIRHTIIGPGFDSDTLDQGDTFSWTFDDTGTFTYTCYVHPSMSGTIIVATAPIPTPTQTTNSVYTPLVIVPSTTNIPVGEQKDVRFSVIIYYPCPGTSPPPCTAPIENANIYANNKFIGSTDRNGRLIAILNVSEPGDIVVNASRPGYGTGNIIIVAEIKETKKIEKIEEKTKVDNKDVYIKDTDTYVHLHGEKTDVVINEDILLRLSAVNVVSNPVMTVQIILYPPSGMSVTSQQFVKSGAGIYTTTYKLEPGYSKDIEINIRPNQIGDFNVKGIIIYYFNDDKDSAESKTQTLPIKVRDIDKEPPKSPGFRSDIVFVIFMTLLFIRMKQKYS